jgi:hypothetical protein
VTLVDDATGAVSLPLFTSEGTYYIQVRYSGSSSVNSAKSATIRLYVN